MPCRGGGAAQVYTGWTLIIPLPLRLGLEKLGSWRADQLLRALHFLGLPEYFLNSMPSGAYSAPYARDPLIPLVNSCETNSIISH
jgi:hypothetical protein